MQTSLFSDSLESMKTIIYIAWKREDKKGSNGLMVTIHGAGKVPLRAVINIQQASSSSSNNNVEAISEFYRGNSKVDNIFELKEVSELQDFAFYQTSVKDNQLLMESAEKKGGKALY